MTHHSQLPPKDRAARSRLIQLFAADNPVARASLVSMARTCGKKGCKCAKGEKHVSLYLSTRVGKTRRMLYVPPELEDMARTLVENMRKAEELIEEMSQASLEHLAQQKAQRKGRPRS